jgi:ankyrin repeat protein
MKYLIFALSGLLLSASVEAAPATQKRNAPLRALIASEAKKTRDPLIRAAYFGDIATARKLLKADIRPNAKLLNIARDGVLPLGAAAASGNTALVTFFLDQGAKLEGRDARGRTALMAAVAVRQHDVVKLLLARRANVNAASYDGATVLMSAIHVQDQDGALLLLKRGARTDATDKSGISALRIAARSGNSALVRLLLSNRANPNRADRKGFTPLHAAVESQSVAVTKLLLDKGAKPNVFDINGEAPLGRAARNGATDIALLLLARGAKADAAKKDGATALHGAASRGDVRLVRELLRRGAKIEATDANGATPLLAAIASDARTGRSETTRLLLSSGARVRVQLKDGTGALHAVMFPRPATRLLELLLSSGADPLVRDAQGAMPLHYLVTTTALLALEPTESRDAKWAARWDDVRAAALLLMRNGGNPNLRDYAGQNVLEMLRAHREGSDEVVQKQYDTTIKLLEGGEDVPQSTVEIDRTPLKDENNVSGENTAKD